MTYKNSGEACHDLVWKGHSKLVEELSSFKVRCSIRMNVCVFLLCLDHPISWRGTVLLAEECLLCPVTIICFIFLYSTAYIHQPSAGYSWGMANVIRSFTDFVCLTSWEEKKDQKEWICLDLGSREHIQPSSVQYLNAMATTFCFPVSCCTIIFQHLKLKKKKSNSKELSWILFILYRISSISVLCLLQECKKDQELEGTDRQCILITVNLLYRWYWLDCSVTLHIQILLLLLSLLEEQQICGYNERCFFLRRQTFQSTAPLPIIR